jgi:hypothetical protein
MAVQRPELTTALQNWQQRASYYSSLGLPQSSWYQIATSDIQNVANTGATPLSTSQVNAAMAAQLAGRTIVGNPTHHSSGWFGDVVHAFTSVPSDVGGLITGFLPGMAHFAAHLPSEATNTWELLLHGSDPEWLSAHGYQSTAGEGALSQAATDIRNIAKSPLLSLIPGVADVANLTTGPGRQYLLSHPVTAALDVAPAGKFAGLATKGAEAAGLLEAGESGSALQALEHGRPITAASRALTARSEVYAAASASIVEAGRKLGVSAQAEALTRSKNEVDRKYSRRIQRLVKSFNEATRKLPLDEVNQITREATLHDIPIPQEHEHIVLMAKEITDKLRVWGEQYFNKTKGKHGLITRAHGQGWETFAAEDPVSKPIRKIDRLQHTLLPRAHKDINRALATDAKNRARVEDLAKRLAAERQRVPPMPTGRLEKDLRDALAKYDQGQVSLSNRQIRLKRLQQALKDNRDEMHQRIMEIGGPQTIHPEVRRRMRTQLKQIRTQAGQTELQNLAALLDPNHPLALMVNPTGVVERMKLAMTNLAKNLDDLEHASNIDQIKDAFIAPARRLGLEAEQYAKQLYDALRADTIKSVRDLVSRGFDPVWLRHVDPGTERRFDGRFAHRAITIVDHTKDISQYRRTTFNWAPEINDIALGLTSAARDYISAAGTDEFLNRAVLPFAKRVQDLQLQYRELSRQDLKQRRRLPTRTLEGHGQAMMNDEWEEIKPKDWGLQDWGGRGRFSKGDTLMIPKWMAINLKSLMPKENPNRFERIPLNGAYDSALHVFRFSVLTGPRHIVHVAIAGLVPLMISEPFSPLYFRRALQTIREVREGKHENTYARNVKNLYDFTDGVYSKAVGAQYGMWAKQFWAATGANVEQKIAKLEETVSDMYRVSASLSAQSRGADIEQALARGNKVAVDMDDMAPFERTILKHVFPFYGFTKFLFRFLLTYPVDHPYRVSILSRFATQEQQDWNSLIPEKFMMTLFLGHPDQNGNIKTVDMRNLNPFRSFSNDFTIAGFFQQINPVIGAALTARGFNPLTATGPLYPSLQYNPNTGTLQAAPPSGRDQLIGALQQFIPEIGSLDHFVGLTDQMRILKRSNPAAYQAQLYSQLNLPGVLSPPITVNLPYVEEKAEMDRYQQASQAVSKYEEGKPSPAGPTSFQVVPYQGQYVDPAAFEKYWQSLIAGSGGVDPRALITTPIRRTSQDPLELLNALGGQLPSPPPTTY